MQVSEPREVVGYASIFVEPYKNIIQAKIQ